MPNEVYILGHPRKFSAWVIKESISLRLDVKVTDNEEDQFEGIMGQGLIIKSSRVNPCYSPGPDKMDYDLVPTDEARPGPPW